MVHFQDLNISEPVKQALAKMGFEEATPIQAEAIPLALEGQDLIGQAQTGTGKTAAFGIPMIESIQVHANHTQGLVVTPTRELAIQVAEELNRIGEFKKVRALPVYGGQDINRQIKALKQFPHIIVGTPGRLLDHLRRKTLRLNHIAHVILDEADEMLNMGFIDDITAILEQCPQEKQTLLFSATMPEPIKTLALRFMRQPAEVKIRAKEVTVPLIDQYYLEVQEKQKFDVLCRLLDLESPELAIVFGRTKRRVDELSEALKRRGYLAEGIHGDLSQNRRDQVINQFRSGTIDILVATDVAARGLDIQGVTHVYNFDIPQDPENYVHRIGRTGRAGQAGQAVTFVVPREIDHLKTIERLTKRKLEKRRIPTINEVLKGRQQTAMETLLRVAEEGDIQAFQRMAQELLEEQDSVTLVAAALKLLTKEPDQTPVRLTAEEPLQVKKKKQVHGRKKRPNRPRYPKTDKMRHKHRP
ncbi:ATP-dependent RNA helicase DeaD [Caldalkalibacillus uzonensis]|uniref:ATP-dependent RNA helicase DeaD n=1 Tax=Caldalkalibacillus uzonensis TaxID=353224 RepID=A0ABU0CTS0_9BACI|nr:DEAD/DEAH box helicase [Caldalkalibacillus uzonensis]MDQ0339823.1 ATP-dependent RNA helicase DeaD [Caldalkalibacillus uzonensis]